MSATLVALRCAIQRSRRGRHLRSACPRAASRRITKRRTSRSKIVFEDEHLLVVDKPAGLVVHPAAGNFDGTLVNALLHHCAGRLSGHRRGGAAGHRPPDRQGHVRACWSSPRPTSRMKDWRRSSRRHSIDRRYLAIVAGRAEAVREGTVDAPLARSSANRKKMAIVEDGRGKRAVTHYRMLQPLQRRGPGRMPARNRADPPGSGAHGLDRPSACSAIRSMAVPGKAHRELLKTLEFRAAGAARGASSASSIR